MERNLIKNKNHLEINDLASILRSFSKMRDGKMAGGDKFFNEMEPVILKNLDKMNMDDFSNVIYAYSVRNQGSEEFNKIVLNKITNEMKSYSTWHVLFNVAWYLLFTTNKDFTLWQSFVDQVFTIEGKMPLVYYRPFKIAAYYIEFNITNIDLFDYKDRFFYAEQYYNYTKGEKFFLMDDRFIHFKTLLNVKLGLYPMISTCFNNLFIINFYWETRKIGINLHLDRDYVPKSDPIRINEHARMHSKMLKLNDWIILDLTWDEYMNIGNQDKRDEFIQNWFTKSCKEQKDRGVDGKPHIDKKFAALE